MECSLPKDAKALTLLRRVVVSFEFRVFQNAVYIVSQFPRPSAQISLDPVKAPPIFGKDCLETLQEFCGDFGRRKLVSGGGFVQDGLLLNCNFCVEVDKDDGLRRCSENHEREGATHQCNPRDDDCIPVHEGTIQKGTL